MSSQGWHSPEKIGILFSEIVQNVVMYHYFTKKSSFQLLGIRMLGIKHVNMAMWSYLVIFIHFRLMRQVISRFVELFFLLYLTIFA